MKKREIVSVVPFSTRYLKRRTTELASPATRSLTDPLAAWALKRIRLDGRPFNFTGHEYLRAIYDDQSPHVVVSKAAQVGGSTYAILRSLHACATGLNVIYFFPTRTDVLDFSRSRVTPLMAENPFLERMLTDTDTAGLKKIGEAFFYMRGMQSQVGMKSVPGDLLVFDELDETEPTSKALAMERLSHSDYKRVIEVSNPSLPDYGIDESYQKSDQRHWTLKCPACGKGTAPEQEFPKKLGEEVRIILPREDGSFFLACPQCQAPLNIDQGEWVAEFPDRRIHGYRISQLFSSKVDPGEILKEYRTTRFADRFYNLKIGVPWADLERRLDLSSVLSLCSEAVMPERAEPTGTYTMGIDTGRELHAVVLKMDGQDRNRQHVVNLSVCHDFEDLDAILARYRVLMCVIDGLPETHATRQFAERHRGIVFMNYFNEHQRGAAEWNHVTGIVKVNRTEALDASREAVRHQRLILPRQTPIVAEFARHMTADAKVLDEDPDTGAQKYRYIRTGPDHFSLAFTYAWMAARRYMEAIEPKFI
jgi:Phage terminase large subunit gpA, ATPase domain